MLFFNIFAINKIKFPAYMNIMPVHIGERNNNQGVFYDSLIKTSHDTGGFKIMRIFKPG